jgi:hypothetical protein
MRSSLSLLAGVLGVFLPAISAGDSLPEVPKIALHIQPHATGKAVQPCDLSPVASSIPCSRFTVTGAVDVGYDLYIVIGQADSTGVGGATFGIDYNGLPNQGVDIFGSWILCAGGLQFPSVGWPGAGTGNVITWNPLTGCPDTRIPPDGVHATAGVFYVIAYGQDRFAVTPHMLQQSGPTLKVANCSSVEQPLPVEAGGYVDFGSGDGYDPCEITPVEPTTWGSLKARY